MDGVRFDRALRTFVAARSRRGLIRAVLGLTLGSAIAATQQPVAAKRKKKACPPCKKRKQGKCKKNLPDGAACAGGACRGGSCVKASGPTCNDGVQNGGETGVDCGGPCARCASGQGCTARNDCASAFCHDSGTCQACSSPSDCPGDGNGTCFCGQPVTAGSTKVCLKTSTTPNGDSSGLSCKCPPGTFCHVAEPQPGFPSFARCHKPCGGGCGDTRARCQTDTDCCYTSCTPEPSTGTKLCLSPPGGRCSQDTDCASCKDNSSCPSACDTAAGVCRCPAASEPSGCCTDAHCGTGEECKTGAFGLDGTCVERPIDV